MNLNLHLALCGFLVLILVASFLYRKFIDDHDDHNIHLHNNNSDINVINTQVSNARRLELLDKLNKYLSIAVVVYLIIIGVMAAYSSWGAQMQL